MSFYIACLQGQLDQVKEYIAEAQQHRNKFDWNYGLRIACEGGHLEIVQLMIEKGAKYLNLGLRNACKVGHLDVVHLLIEKGATSWNEGLEGACIGGHLAIVHLMIEKGADAWNFGLSHACCWFRLDIAALMLDRGATNLNAFKWILLLDEQLQVYDLVTKNEARLQLERQSPVIKERLRLTTIVVLDDRLPDHLIRTIVMEYL